MTPFRLLAFRRLWCSTLAAMTAQGMERTATAWLALESGGAFAIGLAFAARMLPSLLLGLVAGTIADRSDRPRQLLAVAGGSLLLTAAFGWLIARGSVGLWQVVAFSFAAGCLQVFDTPARQALVLDTVPREEAPRALALNALAARLSMAVGAFGAGVLIPLAGIGRCYLAIAVVYAILASLVAALRAPQDRRSLVAPPPFSQALRDAIRLMVDAPAIRTLFIAGLVCEVFAFSHGSALAPFAQEVLAAGAEGLGTLNAAVAAGGAIAVVMLSLLPGRLTQRPMLGAVFLLYGLSLLVFATTRSLAAAAAVLAVTGFCAGMFDVLRQTLIQLAVPDEQRGRAVGVWVLGLGSAPVGHLEMGMVVTALGAPGALSINGALTVAAAATLLAASPDYRWRPLALGK
jgi:MFS family permease